MRLSVLDQSPIAEGDTAARALANTVDLARHAEALGYERYWLAEHHATPALACAAPEVLIAAVAQNTETIRVGSGGVMLPHYSPLKVAEVFSTLAGLHPERPEPWLLGSSPQSAIWAAELGLPYAFADFINPNGAAIAADYRARFLDSERLPAPRVIACAIAVCAETDEEAE